MMMMVFDDEWTHDEGDLQAVMIISAAQVLCLSVSASVTVSQSKGFNRGRFWSRGLTHLQGRDWLATSWTLLWTCWCLMLQLVFSYIKYFEVGGVGGWGWGALPVRKARLSSSVHFVSTKRGGQTWPWASRTPAQTPPEPDASVRRGEKGAVITSRIYHEKWIKIKIQVFAMISEHILNAEQY